MLHSDEYRFFAKEPEIPKRLQGDVPVMGNLLPLYALAKVSFATKLALVRPAAALT